MAMPYIDGFVFAVSKDYIEQYTEYAKMAGAVWMEYGALAYVETVADDVPYGEMTSFPRAVMAKDDETIVFSWKTVSLYYVSLERNDGGLFAG